MILYYPKFEFSLIIIIPILFLFVNIYRFTKLRKSITLRIIRFFKAAAWFIACSIVIFFEFIIALEPILYFDTGDYLTVEGYVENFIPYKSGEMESFSINGVEFEYSSGIIRSGYRKTHNKGGVIRGNGQYLKICYDPGSDYNSILCIQEMPFVDEPEKEISLFMQFYTVTIPIFAAICGYIYIKYKNRKKIRVDDSKSFVKQIVCLNENIVVKCHITFYSTFKTEKKIQIYGNLRKFLNKKSMVKGIISQENSDCINISPGYSKYDIDFITKKGVDYDAADADVCMIIIPKTKIKIID